MPTASPGETYARIMRDAIAARYDGADVDTMVDECVNLSALLRKVADGDYRATTIRPDLANLMLDCGLGCVILLIAAHRTKSDALLEVAYRLVSALRVETNMDELMDAIASGETWRTEAPRG